MLKIQYLESLQEIQITLTENTELWPEVRASILENAEDVTATGANVLRLPVWAFLSCRQGLAYVLRKHDLKFVVDKNVENFLVAAVSRENDYQQALSKSSVTKELLFKKLVAERFTRILTDEQERNILRLSSLPAGATFSVPGAGKTTEALAFYFYKRKPTYRLLVVCPKNAFPAWEEQLSLCVEDAPEIVRLVGGEKNIKKLIKNDNEIFLITYHQLPVVRNLIANLMINLPTVMILDESHHIKRGNAGQWGSTVLSLAHLPIHKLIMSGTPLPNTISDLIPQFNFIFPELDVDETNAKQLIKPVFVRTTKKELGLPEIKRSLVPIQLRPNQRNLYELLRSEEARQLTILKARDRNELRRIGRSVLRLLQVVSNPALLLKRDDINLPNELYAALIEGDSPKIEYACYRARKLAKEGQKVIIWSGFVENVELIASRLIDIGADFIHGGVEAGSEEEENTRENKILRFHNDKNAFVLVANPAACAEGISLHTVCHHAIYLDRNYNAAQYMQSEDRIHRLGLEENIITNIEILYSEDTVDVSVDRRLKNKINKMADVLDDDSIRVEPILIDLDVEGIDLEDAEDFIQHVLGRD